MSPASEHEDAVLRATTVAQVPPPQAHSHDAAPASGTATSPAQQPSPLKRRLRTMTSTEEIDSTINRPGSVKINVQGAFIVDPDTSTPATGGGAAHANGRVSPSHPETSDIRLPNHTAVVSHIAIDVCICHCGRWCEGLVLKSGDSGRGTTNPPRQRQTSPVR